MAGWLGDHGRRRSCRFVCGVVGMSRDHRDAFIVAPLKNDSETDSETGSEMVPGLKCTHIMEGKELG